MVIPECVKPVVVVCSRHIFIPLLFLKKKCFIIALRLYPNFEKKKKKHHVPTNENHLRIFVGGIRLARFPKHTSISWGSTCLCSDERSKPKNAGQAAPRPTGVVAINPTQMCITGSYSFYSCSPDGASESPRWQSWTGLHNPVSAIPCTNKQWVTSEHCDWVMVLKTCRENTHSFGETHLRAVRLRDCAINVSALPLKPGKSAI